MSSLSTIFLDDQVAPLAIASAASSFILGGAAMLELVGPIAVARGRLGPVDLKANERVKVFGVYFKRVAPVMVISSLFVLGGTIAVGRTTTNKDIQFWSYFSAISSLLLHPYTILALLPTNKELLKLADKASKEELSETDEKRADQLIEKWSLRHLVRFAGYGASWFGGFVALILAIDSRKV